VQITPQVRSWARAHHGLVTLEFWTAHGQSASSFYRAIGNGILELRAPKVAALAGTDRSGLQSIAAGVLSFGPRTVSSHRSGSAVWGAPVGRQSPVDLIVPGRRSPTRLKGYVIHRPRDADRIRSVRRFGIAVTTPQRTLFELGAVEPGHVLTLLETMLTNGSVTLRTVTTALARHRRSGRTGVAALERAIADLDGFTVADSELERAMVRVFQRAGLARWEAHPRIDGYEVDFAFRAERVIVEVDGWRYHGADRERWEQDRVRDLTLTAQGWLVLRLTWRMVMRRPTAAAARLTATLATRRAVSV
jgi:very-short-patch-repair endonuclease